MEKQENTYFSTMCHSLTWVRLLNFSFSVPTFVKWELLLVYHMNDVMFNLKNDTNYGIF